MKQKKNIYIIMAENFPKVMTNTKTQIQEAHQKPRIKGLGLGISYSNCGKSKTKKKP